MKVFPDFQEELKQIDSRLEIVVNPNREGLANVKLDGKDVCPVPADEIKDKPDVDYVYRFPNGMIARHKCKEEVLDMVHSTLNFISTPEGADVFFER